MAKRQLLNVGGVPFLVLKGVFIAKPGQKPDGDTVSFAVTQPYRPGPVRTNVPLMREGVKPSNIRLQSIDAPEKEQPMGAKTRDVLLRSLSFNPSELGLSADQFTIQGPMQKHQGWLATHGMDGNRRPLGYVFAQSQGLTHGDIISADDLLPLIKTSVNFRLASLGWAFPAFYENTDEAHAAVFQKTAEKARSKNKGIWAIDRTTVGFIPTPDALQSDGALVYPKFFRRVAKWKTARQSAQAFIAWLKTQEDGQKLVEGAAPTPIPVWKLFEKVNAKEVVVPYDVTRLWFRE